MRVILSESDILMAIEDFILDTVNVPDDIRIDIDLKATRGAEGYTAEIDLIHFTSPADGSDRSVDNRIEAKEEARSEGLGIVEKIDAARSEAKAPRRRGRPAGSKNLPKEAETQAVEETKTDQPEPEAAVEIQEEAAEELNEPMADEASEEVTEDPNISATNEDLIAQAEPLDLPADEPVEEPVEAEPAPAPAPTTSRSLFGGLSSTKADDVPVEAPAAEPEAEDEQVEDPEPNSEAALAAEAAATEPAEEEEDVDYTPTPETAGLSSEDAAPEPAPTRTRSLFADLTKPTN